MSDSLCKYINAASRRTAIAVLALAAAEWRFGIIKNTT